MFTQAVFAHGEMRSAHQICKRAHTRNYLSALGWRKQTHAV